MNRLIDEFVASLSLFGLPVFYALAILGVIRIAGIDVGFRITGALLTVELVAAAIKLLYRKERPFDFAEGKPAALARGGLIAHYLASSFPSVHSGRIAVLATFAFLLFPGDRVIQLLAVLLALGVGYSRIYIKKHYPIDVLCGWALGVAVALLWKSF